MRILALNQGSGRLRPVQETARRGGLPANTLSKIFQRLAGRGLLRAERGPGGGYGLARPAGEISAADILRAVRDILPGGNPCLLGNRLCGKKGFCPVHRVIIRADRLVIDGFKALTLQDLADSEGWTHGEGPR